MRVLNYIAFLFMCIWFTVAFTGCGKGPKGDPGTPGMVVSTPTDPLPDEVQQDIDEIIAQKNADRALLAQAPLTSGLSCVVQKVASGQCLSSASIAAGCNSGNVIALTGTSYTYLYKGNFNQANSSNSDPITFLPSALRPLFQGQNFRISCTGYIVVRESNYYDFSLDSDDGSILSVGGSQVVNNDNNHSMTLKTGSALLYRGVQSFSLMYAQTGSGNYGLVLRSGGSTIDPKYYYH